MKANILTDLLNMSLFTDRLKKMRFRIKSRREAHDERPEALSESPEFSREHTVVTMGGTKDQDSQSTRGDYAAPRQEVANDRTKHFTSKFIACFS